MKYYILAIKNYASIKGRTSRKEFWMFVLFDILFSYAAYMLDKLLGTDDKALGTDVYMPFNYGLIGALYCMLTFVPSTTITVRRLHDIGKSGWWYLRWALLLVVATIMYEAYIYLASGVLVSFDRYYNHNNRHALRATGMPGLVITVLLVVFWIVAGIWLLVLMVRKGTPGTNKYGPNPSEVMPPPIPIEQP